MVLEQCVYADAGCSLAPSQVAQQGWQTTVGYEACLVRPGGTTDAIALFPLKMHCELRMTLTI
jgi:hypothetical protein